MDEHSVCGLKDSEIKRLNEVLDNAFIDAANREWGKHITTTDFRFIEYVGNKMYDADCNTPFPDEPYKVAQEITSGLSSRDPSLVYKGISGMLLGLFWKITKPPKKHLT